MSSIEERIRTARKELEALQTSDHPAHIEEKKQDYIAALKRERLGVEARHAAALARGDEHEKLPSPYKRGEVIESQWTGIEAAAQHARQLGDIDRELERVQHPSRVREAGRATLPRRLAARHRTGG